MTSINNIYKMNKDLDRDAKRRKIQDEFKGKVVMANYGNHKYWKIEDAVFDVNSEDYVVNKDTKETLSH